MAEKKKKNGLKTVLAFMGLGILAVGALVGIKMVDRSKGPNTPPIVEVNPGGGEQQGGQQQGGGEHQGGGEQQEIQLAKPANLAFDEKNGVLSWDSVDHANGYTVTIDNNKFQTNTNSYVFEVPAEANDGEKIIFEVSANASKGYTASEKTTLEHTISMQQEKLKQEIFENLKAGFEYGMKKTYIDTSIDRIDHVNYSENKFFMYGTNSKTGYFARLTFDLTGLCDFENADTLEQLKTASTYLTQVDEQKIVRGSIFTSYDNTVKDLLLAAPRNNSLLSSLYKDGYKITKLSATEFRSGDSGLTMSGVYKCQKGDDIKIISTMNGCQLISYYKDFGVTFEEAVMSEKAYANFEERDTIVFSKAGMDYQNYLDSIEQNLNLSRYSQSEMSR